MRIFEMVMAVIGIGLVAVSLVLYQIRTRDKKILMRFWLGRNLLTGREYVLNRAGFLLWLAAMLMAGASVVSRWLHR